MFKHVLVAVDGSPSDRAASEAAIEAADPSSATVTVLHVVGQKVTWATSVELETEAAGVAVAERATRPLSEAGFSPRVEVLHAPTGRIADEILRVAADIDASVIVMGTKRMSDASAILLGSVAHSVVHRATCPVLLVPTPHG